MRKVRILKHSSHIEKEFSDKAQEKKISFSVQRRGSFADQYLFDREKLNEALSAILENAVKYTQPEGSVFFYYRAFYQRRTGNDLPFRDPG